MGNAKEGDIISIYPGLIYYPADPIFFPSIKNSFILRFADGSLVDGKYKSLSAYLYRSIADRYSIYTNEGVISLCNQSWISSCSLSAKLNPSPYPSSLSFNNNNVNNNVNNIININNNINHNS